MKNVIHHATRSSNIKYARKENFEIFRIIELKQATIYMKFFMLNTRRLSFSIYLVFYY